MQSNWVKATTTTTGTGTLTLAVVTGRPLPSIVHALNERVQYSIVTADGKFESGIGTIGAANTLSRDRIASTYDGTTYNNTSATALSLAAGTHTVFITPMAETGIITPLPSPLVGPTNAAVASTHINAATTANIAPTAQRPYAYPFRLETAGVLTGFALWVSTAGAGSSVDLGLYEVGANGRPGRRIAKTAVAIDTTTTGYKTQAADVNVRLTPGWYFIAVVVVGGTSPAIYSRSHGMSMGAAIGYALFVQMYENVLTTSLADPFPLTTPVYQDSSSVATIPYLQLQMT